MLRVISLLEYILRMYLSSFHLSQHHLTFFNYDRLASCRGLTLAHARSLLQLL